MRGPSAFLLLLLGAVTSSQDSGGAFNLTVRAGENATLHCDCQTSTGVYILWYRNCSHENQPPLVLKPRNAQTSIFQAQFNLNPFPGLHLMFNESSKSYDLLIVNITHSDEGLYYCGTVRTEVVDKEKITQTEVHRYGNITTRIMLDSSDPHVTPQDQDCAMCWKLLFTLCPGLSVLFSFLASILVYRLSETTANEPQLHQNTTHTRGQTNRIPDEDLCLTQVEFWAVEGKTHSSTEARMYKLTR
ncbi:uncharacterized protein LOC142994815 isoform X2 [Genypterus blacodes]|uniref:uncharacterized protein LOC142994815 isoform X2 n=1 Tax=Genypterus blacodes TaxID=154954 RepID=UPI003F770A08